MTLRLHLLLLFTMCALSGYCQKTTDDYYQEGIRAERFSDDSTAIKDFNFILENHPSSVLCPFAYFHLGRVYRNRNGMEGAAIKAYTSAIAAPEDKSALKLRDIWPTDYQYEAAYDLCNIYEHLGRYDSALYFLGQYDTVFHTFYDDNFGYDAAKMAATLKYAEIYLLAKRSRDAECALLSHHKFRAQHYQHGDEIVKKLDTLFREYEQAPLLKTEMDRTMDNFFFDTVRHFYGTREDTSIYCCISFLGVKVHYVYQGELFEESAFGEQEGVPKPWEREKIIASLKKSDLYTIVNR